MLIGLLLDRLGEVVSCTTCFIIKIGADASSNDGDVL